MSLTIDLQSLGSIIRMNMFKLSIIDGKVIIEPNAHKVEREENYKKVLEHLKHSNAALADLAEDLVKVVRPTTTAPALKPKLEKSVPVVAPAPAPASRVPPVRGHASAYTHATRPRKPKFRFCVPGLLREYNLPHRPVRIDPERFQGHS